MQTLFTEKAEEIIRDHSYKEGIPLFLYVAYQNIHGPIEVPYGYIRDDAPRGARKIVSGKGNVKSMHV